MDTKTLTFIYVILLISIAIIIKTAGEPCATAEKSQVVNICRKATTFQDSSKIVIIKADSRNNCTCELSVIQQNQSISVYIKPFGGLSSSHPSILNCGLILQFDVRNDVFWVANCLINGFVTSRQMDMHDVITIKSFAVNGTFNKNEGYCIEMKNTVDHSVGNQLKLRCGTGSITPTHTSTKSEEITSKISMTTETVQRKTSTATTPVISITTPTVLNIDQSSSENSASTDGSLISTKQPKQSQQMNKDNDNTTVLAAGASVVGFVIIVITIVAVFLYRRYHSKPTSSPGPAFDESDTYGMRDNVLYVSSQQTTEITVTQNSGNCQNTNRISIDTDGNYSTVDLDEVPQVEDLTGDYSSIDLVKPKMSKSNINGSTNGKPTIAPKPKQKVTIRDDVYSVPDKKRVKHVTAPGENGCEYAVVSKLNKANVDKIEDQPLTSNVYAVVEKKKRLSDGKGTNKKRDSSTAENDRETGRSSKR